MDPQIIIPPIENKPEPLLVILHFNDVYDIQPNKFGCLGIVNFQACIKDLKQKHPKSLILFSGDAFSPSALSNIFEGTQMVKSLNSLEIDVACYGNHQFDLQPQITVKLAKQCNFPWLLGNIRYAETDKLLGQGLKYIVKQHQSGLRIGIFGIAGEDWLGILGEDYQDELQYDDYVEHSKKMCQILKKQLKCDMIIALTHMRVPSDENLPVQVQDIDLVLGGHDHIVMQKFINNVLVVKSGDNFKSLRVIQLYEKNKLQNPKYKGKQFDFQTNIIRVPKTNNPNLQLQAYVDKCMEEYLKNDRIVGWTDVELQTRFKHIRTAQTNYGNFMSDLVRLFYQNQIVILNSGGCRIDELIKPGPLHYSTVSNIINDILVIKLVKGNILMQALQYACSSCPDTFAGSFLQISGMSYTFDTRKTPRVQEVLIGGKPLQLQRQYTVAGHSYMLNGGDGYDMLKQCPFDREPAASIDLLSLILKFFKTGQTVSSLNSNDLSLRHIKSKDKESENGEIQEMELPALKKKPSIKISRISKLRNRVVITEDGYKIASISPVTQGRIKSLYP